MFTFERRRQHRHSRLQHRRQPLSPLPLRGCTLLRLRLRQRGTLIRVGHFQYWLVMIVVYGQHHVDVHGLGMFALAGRRRMPIDEHLDGLGLDLGYWGLLSMCVESSYFLVYLEERTVISCLLLRCRQDHAHL